MGGYELPPLLCNRSTIFIYRPKGPRGWPCVWTFGSHAPQHALSLFLFVCLAMFLFSGLVAICFSVSVSCSTVLCSVLEDRNDFACDEAAGGRCVWCIFHVLRLLLNDGEEGTAWRCSTWMGMLLKWKGFEGGDGVKGGRGGLSLFCRQRLHVREWGGSILAKSVWCTIPPTRKHTHENTRKHRRSLWSNTDIYTVVSLKRHSATNNSLSHLTTVWAFILGNILVAYKQLFVCGIYFFGRAFPLKKQGYDETFQCNFCSTLSAHIFLKFPFYLPCPV